MKTIIPLTRLASLGTLSLKGRGKALKAAFLLPLREKDRMRGK